MSATASCPFKHYDRDLIRDDLEQRVTFSRDFLRFDEESGKTLNSVASVVAPLVKPVVDQVYVQLFRFDYTASFFLKRNVGFEGEHATTLDKLTLDDPQIAFRKSFLVTWVTKCFTSDFEKFATWEYFAKVARMHTGQAAFKHRQNKAPLVVDLQPAALLFGWVIDVVIKAVMALDNDVADLQQKQQIICAFNKLIWCQNDLWNMVYAKNDEELAAATLKAKVEDPSA